MMNARMVLLFLYLLDSSWVGLGRILVTHHGMKKVVFHNSVLQLNYENPENEIKLSEATAVDIEENVCALCEKYSARVIDYLKENKTQTVVVDALHDICSQVPHFSQECIAMVDDYIPPLFLKISSLQPEYLCHKINLCEQEISISPTSSENRCDLCHQTVAEILLKLEDPDMQLEIIQMLLKACNSVDNNYVKKCKRMVFEYAPLILSNAEKFLKTNDLCLVFHACGNQYSSS